MAVNAAADHLTERLIRNALLCQDPIGEVRVKLEITPMGVLVTAGAADIRSYRTVPFSEIADANSDPLRLAVDQTCAQVNETLNTRLGAARSY